MGEQMILGRVQGQVVASWERFSSLTSYISTARPAKAHEIRDLIEELLEHLPEDERQTFKQRIKTEGMI